MQAVSGIPDVQPRRFRRGESPSDFPKEDYEVEWASLGIKRSARVVQQKEFAATDA
jgi:hypothetical protein